MTRANKDLVKTNRVIDVSYEEPRQFSPVEWRDHLQLSKEIGALETRTGERCTALEARVSAIEGQNERHSTTKLAVFVAVVGLVGAVVGGLIGPVASALLK